jgi:hypothetical protein
MELLVLTARWKELFILTGSGRNVSSKLSALSYQLSAISYQLSGMTRQFLVLTAMMSDRGDLVGRGKKNSRLADGLSAEARPDTNTHSNSPEEIVLG